MQNQETTESREEKPRSRHPTDLRDLEQELAKIHTRPQILQPVAVVNTIQPVHVSVNPPETEQNKEGESLQPEAQQSPDNRKTSRFQVSVIPENENKNNDPGRETRTGRFSVVTHDEPGDIYLATSASTILMTTTQDPPVSTRRKLNCTLALLHDQPVLYLSAFMLLDLPNFLLLFFFHCWGRSLRRRRLSGKTPSCLPSSFVLS